MIQFFKRLFAPAPTHTNDGFYHDGDKVSCQKCNRSLRIKYFPRKGIMTGNPSALKGFAIKCTSCAALFCVDCALDAGLIACCPKCKGSIATFTEGNPVHE